MRQLTVRTLQICEYDKIWQQMRLFTSARSAADSDELWLLQHKPVYTLGQNGQKEHIINKNTVPVITTDRGGQVTFHGPGQMMIYTLFNIKRLGLGVKQFVKELEQCIIDLLAQYGIAAQPKQSAPGVYVDEAKICSIGLRVRRGCSYHGLAFNVAMDLQPFQDINPCGYRHLKMTQLTEYTNKVSWSQLELDIIKYIKHRFQYEITNITTNPWESLIHETA